MTCITSARQDRSNLGVLGVLGVLEVLEVLGVLGVFATEIGLLVRALVVVLAPINI
jgi:hypothetical protein